MLTSLMALDVDTLVVVREEELIEHLVVLLKRIFINTQLLSVHLDKVLRINKVALQVIIHLVHVEHGVREGRQLNLDHGEVGRLVQA